MHPKAGTGGFTCEAACAWLRTAEGQGNAMAEVTAFEFDTSGRAKARDPAGLDVNATAAGGFVWVNVNATGAGGRGWLEAAGLDPISLAAPCMAISR
jgi:hypothetical protein